MNNKVRYNNKEFTVRPAVYLNILTIGLIYLFLNFTSGNSLGADSEIVTTAQVVPQEATATGDVRGGEDVADRDAASEQAFRQEVATSGQLPSDDSAVIPGGMNGKISLDLRNIDVVDALKFLAMKASLNIIATKDVAGRVTLMVDTVPVKDVFDIMLRSNGLAYVRQGDIYNVMTEEEYKAIFGRNFSDLRKVKVFRLKYAIPEQAFSLLDTLKSEVGRVLVEPDSGTALIMDTPENIKQIESAIAALEQKNLVQIFTLKYAKAKDVEEQLKTQLDAKKVGSVKADERSNQVIVQALPDRMAGIEQIIAALDTKTKQVLIDTTIVKVKLSNQMTTGLDWQGLVKTSEDHLGFAYMGSTPFSVLQAATSTFQTRNDYLASIGNQVGAYPFSGNTSSVNTSTPVKPGVMHLGVINQRRDVDLMIQYLQTLGRTQILSNPQLAVTNNQEAKIHVGERQAYVTTTTTTGQTTTTVSEEVTFVDVGIQLAVTPTINDDGYVTMKVKPEISSVVSSLTTPSGNKIPIIDTSMAETTVMVKDGATIVIGGLRKEEKVSASDGIPLLSKIPIIGKLFQQGTNKTERTELLVMMTPHIVSGEQLTTGEEREFDIKPSKEYKEYRPFNDQTDVKPLEAPPEDKIKPYRQYMDSKPEEDEPVANIKGERDNE